MLVKASVGEVFLEVFNNVEGVEERVSWAFAAFNTVEASCDRVCVVDNVEAALLESLGSVGDEVGDRVE